MKYKQKNIGWELKIKEVQPLVIGMTLYSFYYNGLCVFRFQGDSYAYSNYSKIVLDCLKRKSVSYYPEFFKLEMDTSCGIYLSEGIESKYHCLFNIKSK